MILTPGTRLGPYTISSPLGAGGMGEVYRARDSRLNRDVAIKVLRADVANDRERLARFDREARLLAALNHPNIANVIGLEGADDAPALVMELVEGPTLALRIDAGALSVEEALEIARQIAEALEAAHERGIVHRDLKPANVKVRADGLVKVLDFGLAKALDPTEANGAAPLADSPTITSPAMTARAVILGTAAYMAPEQAKGRPVDRRADIWACGCVLYEMLTGRRAFQGEDTAETLAAVLSKDPDWTALPLATHASIRRLLQRMLVKNPKLRIDSAAVVRLELADAAAPSSEAHEVSVPRRTGWPAWVMVAAAATSAMVAGLLVRDATRPDGPPPVTRFRIASASGERLANTTRSFGVSRDGRFIAYAGVKDGRRQLYLRRLDQSDAVAIAGTDDATYPVFSPDGDSVAFWADGWIKRVPVAGGIATSIAPAQAPRGLAWAPGDRIVFAAGASSGLSVVPASGGAPEPLTELDAGHGETNHRWPIVLPDGSGVLFAVQKHSRTELDIEGVSFRSKARTSVRSSAFPVQILETGHLVYAAVNGDTFAAPFDVERMALTEPSMPLPERPGYGTVPGMTSPALSPAGTMVSIPLQEPARRLVVVSRNGARRVLDLPPRNYQNVRVSPGGHRIAVVTLTGISEWDIWTMDTTAGGPLRRVTVNGFSTWPGWESEDTLLYSAFENGIWTLRSHNVDLNQPARTLQSGLTQEPRVLGRFVDRSLAYTLNLPQQDLFVAKGGDEPQILALPETGRFVRILHGLSPNGRWLTYTSEGSGLREVYMTALFGGATTRKVSHDGGDFPVWAKSGQQLFYQRARPDRTADVLSVPVGPDGRIGPSTVVATGDVAMNLDFGAFDVFPDGSVLMIEELPAPPPSLDVVVNWPALRGLAPLGR